MIIFNKLWKTMELKGVSTYMLREKCGIDSLSPCGFAAPSSSKKGNTTKLQNKPTTETPNKLVGEPAASPKEEAHFLLQNSALLRNFLMTSPRQTTSSWQSCGRVWVTTAE